MFLIRFRSLATARRDLIKLILWSIGQWGGEISYLEYSNFSSSPSYRDHFLHPCIQFKPCSYKYYLRHSSTCAVSFGGAVKCIYVKKFKNLFVPLAVGCLYIFCSSLSAHFGLSSCGSDSSQSSHWSGSRFPPSFCFTIILSPPFKFGGHTQGKCTHAGRMWLS